VQQNIEIIYESDMKIKSLHAIWVTFNGKLPDNVVAGLQIWKKTIPKTYQLYFWCNASQIEPKYLNYLNNLGVVILDIQSVINVSSTKLRQKLEYLLENGQIDSYLNIKLFSDIMRMLLMSMQGSNIFSGIYIDITDTAPTTITTDRLESLELKHDFAFRVQGSDHVFDSNVSIFSPASEFDSNTLAKKIIGVYFARLDNWDLSRLKDIPNVQKTAITNIFSLLHEDTSDNTKSKLFSGEIVETKAINAGELLALSPVQNKIDSKFTLELGDYGNTLNFEISSLDEASIVFSLGDSSIASSCKTPIPFYSPYNKTLISHERDLVLNRLDESKYAIQVVLQQGTSNQQLVTYDYDRKKLSTNKFILLSSPQQNTNILTPEIVQKTLGGRIPGLSKISSDPSGDIRLFFDHDNSANAQYKLWADIDGMSEEIYLNCIEISKNCSNKILNAMLIASLTAQIEELKMRKLNF
jgi:hypothetical protein